MADLEENKETVRASYERAFNQKEPEEAVARHVGSSYIQQPGGRWRPRAVRRVRQWLRRSVARPEPGHQAGHRGRRPRPKSRP